MTYLPVRSPRNDSNATGDADADDLRSPRPGVPTHPPSGTPQPPPPRKFYFRRRTSTCAPTMTTPVAVPSQRTPHGAQTVPPRPAIAPSPADAGAEPRDGGLRVASRLAPRSRPGTFMTGPAPNSARTAFLRRRVSPRPSRTARVPLFRGSRSRHPGGGFSAAVGSLERARPAQRGSRAPSRRGHTSHGWAAPRSPAPANNRVCASRRLGRCPRSPPPPPPLFERAARARGVRACTAASAGQSDRTAPRDRARARAAVRPRTVLPSARRRVTAAARSPLRVVRVA